MQIVIDAKLSVVLTGSRSSSKSPSRSSTKSNSTLRSTTLSLNAKSEDTKLPKRTSARIASLEKVRLLNDSYDSSNGNN